MAATHAGDAFSAVYFNLAQKGIALGLINHNLLSDLPKIMGDPVALGTEAFP
jgi:hypothetical protein